MKKCFQCEKDLWFGYYMWSTYEEVDLTLPNHTNILVCQECLKEMINSDNWHIEDMFKEFLNNSPKIPKKGSTCQTKKLE